MLLGFSTGCLYKTRKSILEIIKLIADIGCNAIELAFLDIDELNTLDDLIKGTFRAFEYVSFHAPALDFIYQDEKVTKDLLDKIQRAYNNFNLEIVVIHPDRIASWEVFNNFSISPAIENMDNRKPVGKTVRSLQDLFNRYEMDMVLDLMHCYTNDKSMNLARELSVNFKDKIKEIHLSGFDKHHAPLYKTKQTEIIEAIPDKNLPIIIESVNLHPNDLKRE